MTFDLSLGFELIVQQFSIQAAPLVSHIIRGLREGEAGIPGLRRRQLGTLLYTMASLGLNVNSKMMKPSSVFNELQSTAFREGHGRCAHTPRYDGTHLSVRTS